MLKCLNPDCTKEGATRGLCTPCYQCARRLIKLGQTSWKALEDAGRATKPGNASSKTIEWLLKGGHIAELEFQETGKVTPP